MTKKEYGALKRLEQRIIAEMNEFVVKSEEILTILEYMDHPDFRIGGGGETIRNSLEASWNLNRVHFLTMQKEIEFLQNHIAKYYEGDDERAYAAESFED